MNLNYEKVHTSEIESDDFDKFDFEEDDDLREFFFDDPTELF